MDKVKKLVAAGATIPGAIREALTQNGLTVAGFAEKYRRPRTNLTSVLSGTRAPNDADLDALIAELGGTADEWRKMLHDAGDPEARLVA